MGVRRRARRYDKLFEQGRQSLRRRTTPCIVDDYVVHIKEKSQTMGASQTVQWTLKEKRSKHYD
jgi:hypothetical protein